MVKMVNATGVTMEVAPEQVTAMSNAGFSVVTAANSDGPLPKTKLNKEQRLRVATTNSSQSLVIPPPIAEAVKAGKLESLEAKVTDFLLKKSKSGGNYVACQIQVNYNNTILKFCILDDVQNPKLEIDNLVTIHLEETDDERIRSGVQVHKVD